MTAGWLSLWVGRSASGTWPRPRSAGRSTPACSATAPRRGTPRGFGRLDSAPTAGWWRPVTGMASASGRPTRAANWPISRRVSARACCSIPKAQSLISSSRWGLYRWPIRPDPNGGRRDSSRSARAAARGRRVESSDLAARSSDFGADRQRQARVLLVDSSHPRRGWSRGKRPSTRRESPHDLGGSQPGRPVAGGRGTAIEGRTGLGPAPPRLERMLVP